MTLSVDDEPQVANAIQRDLRPRYGRNYHILKTNTRERKAWSSCKVCVRKNIP